jgi:hypothetical protein
VGDLAAMTTQDKEFSLEFSRRKLLAAAGIGGVCSASPIIDTSMSGLGHKQHSRTATF